jgi:hypothetical protein
LAGDVEHVAPVLKTWEDYVWARFHALLDSDLDKELLRLGEDVLTPVEQLSLPLPPEPLRPKEIFESLLKHSDPQIR